jgi:hypothetical protein
MSNIFKKFKFILLAISFITINALSEPNPNKDETPIAIIKSFSGTDIIIKYKNQNIQPKNYLNLFIDTEIFLPVNSIITIIFKNGEKHTLNEKLYFAIKENSIKPLNPETEKYLSSANIALVYSKKDTLSSRGKNENLNEIVPDNVLKEIGEIEKSITDPMLLALAKAECYKANGLTKHAKEEYKKHLNLIKK